MCGFILRGENLMQSRNIESDNGNKEGGQKIERALKVIDKWMKFLCESQFVASRRNTPIW